MKKGKNYETVSEATSDLIKRSYTAEFSILIKKELLFCNKTPMQLSPNEFKIDETYRF